MLDSVRPHRRQPTRLPCPWDSPGKNTGVGCHFLLQCMKVKSKSEVAQPCPTLPDPMDCSLPGSSVHGIFQERVLEWDAIAFSSQLTNMLFSCFFISLIITEKEHLFMLLLVTFFFVWGLVSLCPLEFKNIIFKNSLRTEARNPLSYVF